MPDKMNMAGAIQKVQEDFIDNPNAFKPGRRNDDVVDFLILCWCTGIDYRTVIGEIAYERGWDDAQTAAVFEKVDVVEPYLDGWGDARTMEALKYAINY